MLSYSNKISKTHKSMLRKRILNIIEDNDEEINSLNKNMDDLNININLDINIPYNITKPHYINEKYELENINECYNNSLTKHSNIIKTMWKNNNSIHELNKAYKVCNSLLTHDKLQDLSNMCKSVNNVCKGDGAGLTGGILIDMLLTTYFSQELKDHYVELHSGESDMKIDNTKLSLKKINGKSTIALDWSKNNTQNTKKYFNSDIVIVNLQSQKWWKSKPNKITTNTNITYNDEIKSGIYFVDKKYCKRYIKLSSNNKTNSLIEPQYLYLMLKRSMRLRLYIELPTPNKTIDFNILHAFSK